MKVRTDAGSGRIVRRRRSRFDFEAGGFRQGRLTLIEGEELRGAKRDRHPHMQEVEAAHAKGFSVRGSKAFCLLEGIEGLPVKGRSLHLLLLACR